MDWSCCLVPSYPEKTVSFWSENIFLVETAPLRGRWTKEVRPLSYLAGAGECSRNPSSDNQEVIRELLQTAWSSWNLKSQRSPLLLIFLYWLSCRSHCPNCRCRSWVLLWRSTWPCWPRSSVPKSWRRRGKTLTSFCERAELARFYKTIFYRDRQTWTTG